jgi:hypothetical protein
MAVLFPKYVRHSFGKCQEGGRKMTEGEMVQIMKEVGERMGYVNDMDVVPVEVIDKLVKEMETRILTIGGNYGNC